MEFYQAPDGQIYADPADPTGMVEISKEEALAIANPPASFEQVQATSLTQIDHDYAAALLAAVGNPTEAERDTWPIKRECALAWQARNASEAQQTSLTRYAEARGQSVTDYVALVMAAADKHEQAAAYFEGIKTSAKADIIAAATIEEIETILSGIDWSYPREIKS